MTDLEKLSAEAIGKWVDEDHPGCPGNADTAQKIMELHGVLVSHEDAALLREVKRMVAAINAVKPRTNFIDYIGYTMDEKQLKVRFCGEPRQPGIGRGDTLAAALKSALDAAGVPDEKGT